MYASAGIGSLLRTCRLGVSEFNIMALNWHVYQQTRYLMSQNIQTDHTRAKTRLTNESLGQMLQRKLG